MSRLIQFALPLLLSVLLPATLVLADTPAAGAFSWTSTTVTPTIALSTATAAATTYLAQQAQPDQATFVQIENAERRGNVTRLVFYGWQLHYAKVVSKNARCGQSGLTLLVNGAPAVYGGDDGSTLLWPEASVAADIPDPAPLKVPPCS